jgi:hypothetical protein
LRGTVKGSGWRAIPSYADPERQTNAASYAASTNNHRRWIMPFLIPVLIGIPVLFGGGYVIYHLVH